MLCCTGWFPRTVCAGACRDGLNFDQRFMEAFLRPGPNPLNWHERAIQVGPTLVPTAPGEMSLYYAEQAKTTQVRIRRAVLVLNYSTSAAGSIRVEIQDPYGDETQREVIWQTDSSVQELAGRTIRLKVSMRDADLYSLRFH